ncbi:MAG: tRNA pseudouridine(38-40) synthase TruA [Methanoregulaceae archaeon]|nr:tRNA pseudouridine(38-40) synthase TruA [Methanoregulaceae archaeon]
METDQAPDQAPAEDKVRLAFRTCYLGDRFAGSQMQAGSRTVEGEFVAACMRLGLFPDWRSAGFYAAGRTDRGVHSRGQVYAFTTPHPDRAIAALNWQLPPDCWCTGYAIVGPQFHPRYDARSRTYRYYFGEAELDYAAMDKASRSFCGSHNFTGFARANDKNPNRCVLSAKVAESGCGAFFEVRAESYLWHMVRYMAAALVLVGEGRAGESFIQARLAGDLSTLLGPASPEGLVLWDVDCGLGFVRLEADDRSRRFVVATKARHSVMVRVCEVLEPDENPVPGKGGYDGAL